MIHQTETDMEIIITTGTYNTSNYRVVKEYKGLKAAQKFIERLGYVGGIYNGLEFSNAGTNYRVIFN